MARVAQEGNIQLITAGLVDWATMVEESELTEGGIDAAGAGKVPTVKARGGRPLSTRPTPTDAGLPTIGDGATEETEFFEVLERHTPSAIPASPEETPGESAETQLGPMSPALEAMLSEAATGLDLPRGADDGMATQRIADLIVMADTLEHREGLSHVAFNFLVAEVCQALEQGLEAEYSEITQRWAQVYSRSYVSKMFRGLSLGNMFQRGWHSWRDETSGHQRRRRTFNLDRSHPAVEQVLNTRWEHGDSRESEETPSQQSIPEHQFRLDPVDTADTLEGTHDSDPVTGDAERSVPSFLSRIFRPRS